MLQLAPSQVQDVIAHGGVIAYPTEAVYGLGCDPQNEAAIQKILDIKQRPWHKGLILIASELSQLTSYVDFDALTQEQLAFVNSKWPGPVTFVMPIRPEVSKLICGQFESVAVRVSAHPVVKALCEQLDSALISTSANLAGEPPAISLEQVERVFSDKIDAAVTGELGKQTQPSSIIDACTSKVLR